MARHIEQLIAQQVRLWDERRRKAREAQQRLADGDTSDQWPTITISREFGARGGALAQLLGAEIGFDVWDNELLHAIAEMTGADMMILESLDEHRRQAVSDIIQGAVMGVAHTSTEYLKALMRVIHTVATHGESIIVGRGAPYILPTNDILSVRVVAPLDDRIKGYASRENITARQARRKISKMDRFRADFMHSHFKRGIDDASGYDLIMNAGRFNLEQCAELVRNAYLVKFGRRLPKEQL